MKSKAILMALLALVFDGVGAVSVLDPAVDVGGRTFVTLDQALAYAATNDHSVVKILREVDLSQSFMITNTCVIMATNPVTSVSMVLPTRDARLTIGEGGSLVISNLTVHGYVGSYLFHVCGGEMTLAKGAVLSDLNRVTAGEDAGNVLSGGVTILEGGTFTMLPGAAIRGCSTVTDVNFNGYGGGICAWGGKLNLLGGEISNCSADRGGGVYADMSWGDLEVNLGGDLRIIGNRYAGGTGAEPDNLCVAGLSLFEEGVVYHPVVVAPLSDSARIGICYDGDRTGNEAGEVFATVADSLTAEEAGAKAFSNDINQKLRPEIDEEGGRKVLRWSTTTEGKVDPDDVSALTIYGEGTAHSVSNYHEWVEQAFLDLTNDATIVLLKGDYCLVGDVPVNYKVIFRADESLPSSAHLVRSSDMSFKIAAGASLTVGNVWLDGNRTRRVQPFFDVCGGSLTLGEGAAISDVSGWDSPSACAVWVSNQGVFRMEEGSEIRSCENAYKGMTDGVEKDADAGLAGGVALSGGTAYLHGGAIFNCVAQKGGAIFVGNDSSAYVSGAFVATENGCWKDSPDPAEARASNVTYDGNGRIVLDGVYDGAAGVSRGWNVGLKVNGEETLVTADTNIFGFVEGDVGALADSARRFHKDAGKGIYGVIATNDVRKLLVWSSAAADGKFVGEDGTVYGVVEGSEPPPAPKWTVVTNRPMEIAFKSIERVSDTEWALVVTDRVEYCNYRLIWTDDLTKGFTSTGEWEHAVGEAASAQWETNVITTGGARFWRVEGADGTNMVLKTVEE